MDNKAYVTLLSDNSYINGLAVMAESLKATNPNYPLYCIVTPAVSKENINVLLSLGVQLIEKDIIVPKGYSVEDSRETLPFDVFGWHNALVKFNIFDLTNFEKIVYLDTDIVVKQNLDYLFDKPHMSACRDCFGFDGYFGGVHSFCTGLLVVEPSHQTFLDLIEFFYGFNPKKGLIHDQLVLQEFYKDWPLFPELALDVWVNPWTTYFEGYEYEYYYMQNKVKSIHIIDVKPWKRNKQYFIDKAKNYPIYSKLSLEYIDLLNYTITRLAAKGIVSSDLKIIN